MGRLKMGAGVEPVKRSPKFSRKDSVKGVLVPTRRRPFGMYDVLNVDPTSNDAVIKKAYLLRTRELHPDKNINESPQKRGAQRRQLDEVQNAYSVLSDPTRRKKYDTLLHITENSSTIRSRVHRSRQSVEEKKITTAVNVARKKIDQAPLPRRKEKTARMARTICTIKTTTLRSTVIAPDSKWIVLRRRRSELVRDRRRSEYLAVPQHLLTRE